MGLWFSVARGKAETRTQCGGGPWAIVPCPCPGTRRVVPAHRESFLEEAPLAQTACWTEGRDVPRRQEQPEEGRKPQEPPASHPGGAARWGSNGGGPGRTTLGQKSG